ncbi:alpha/beta hydrolase family protein [Thermodesulfobacteriota bacterium]
MYVKIVLFILSFSLVLCINACSEDCENYPDFDPSKPGPYLVGNSSFIFEDADRNLSCGPGKRRLVTEVWYPAVGNAGEWDLTYLRDFMLDQLEAAIEKYGEDAIKDLSTGSHRNAPLHPEAGPLPLLLFSHGFSSVRFQNYSMAEYLASHGYLVISPDHTCGAMIAPLPEGAVFFHFLNTFITIWERIGDLSFLIDQFTEDPPEMFAGRLDTGKIGIWGHSFGGWTVSETVKSDPRVSAMLQLASFGVPNLPEEIDVSSMYMWGRQDKIMHPMRTWHFEYLDLMPVPKYNLEFFDTGHFAFSDLCAYAEGSLPLDDDGCGSGRRIDTGEPFENPGHTEMHKVMNAYATAFFGAVLQDLPVHEEYIRSNHFESMMDYEEILE